MDRREVTEDVQSTVRAPRWRKVNKGDTIGLPCEGGYVNRAAEEAGVVFELEGQDGVFIPESMVELALAAIKDSSVRRKGKQK